MAFVVAFFVGCDLSEGPFDAFEGCFQPLLGHAHRLPHLRVPVTIQVFRQPGTENSAAIMHLTDALCLQGDRNQEKQ